MSARGPSRRAILGTGLGLALAAVASGGQDPRSSRVGMEVRIADLVLPGSELEVAPPRSDAALVLRIAAVRPHGDAFRYDLEYWGLEAGAYDLRDWLRRRDGSTTNDLPPLPVTFTSALPEGRIEPAPPAPRELPGFGGYRTLLLVGGALWLLGLVALLVVGRRRRLAEEAARPRALTLAERLRPLVERATQGELGRAERAQLELSLVAYWRRKLELEDRRPQQVISLLREHPEAGPLLRGLEDWLHRPEPPTDVDVAALLAPYRDLPADALDEVEPQREA
jgi:hypothetical protein